MAQSIEWQHEADIVVVGSGAVGLPAAIVAREAGLSVIVIEAEADIGGHAITSGGNVPLGGGTSAQRKYGIEDSPDLLFADLTDWSVVQPNGFPDYRYNDREIIRAFADNSAASYEWLVAHGVIFADKAPDDRGGYSVGNSAPREMHSVPVDWPLVQTGQPATPEQRLTFSTGNGLMRPLETAAKKAGVEILLRHRMTALHRPDGKDGRVTGIAVDHQGKTLNIRAKKAVILGTGGGTGNVDFDAFFGALAKIGYKGTITFESFSSAVVSPELSSTLGIWRNLWTDNKSMARSAREYMEAKIVAAHT
jgi:succinate dehydrogenase/fumarate reductase flavoprotein subunit